MQLTTHYVGYQGLPPKIAFRVTTTELTQHLNTLKLGPIERSLTVPHF